jgi:hypothetical protein
MPVTELLFSGDTTEEGRVKINDAYNQDCIWTGSTGDFTGITKNIITNNDGNNIISGDSAANSSVVEYSSILAGTNNTIFGQAPFNTSIKNSSIVSGNNNFITHNAGFVDIENCVIVGGGTNAITGTSDISNTVILGGQGLTGNTSDTVYAQSIQSFGARVRGCNIKTMINSDWVTNTISSSLKKLDVHDEYVFIYNNVSTTPAANEYNFDVSDLLSSPIGRVVDVTSTYFFGGTEPIKIGVGPLFVGADIFINGVSLNSSPITINSTNATSVRFVVKEKVGTITYVEMYGTGA